MTQGSGPDVGKCASCGAALTPEDYNAAACRFCGAAHVHHLRTAEKVAQVQGVMAGMMGMANMNMYGSPPSPMGMQSPPGAFPGGPGAFAPPPGGYPAAQGAAAWQQMQSAFVVQEHVQRATSIVRVTIILMVVLFMLVGLGVAFFVFQMG
ncbi:MAG: hypothetical protein U0174_05975 [Polyangiaceae bacterium]